MNRQNEKNVPIKIVFFSHQKNFADLDNFLRKIEDITKARCLKLTGSLRSDCDYLRQSIITSSNLNNTNLKTNPEPNNTSVKPNSEP